MDIPDHRRLGRQLDIYTTAPECGSGLPLFAPAGEVIREQLTGYVRALERRHGYEHVSTPVLGMVEAAYAALHLPAPVLRLSRGGSGPKYAGAPDVWARSEDLLREAMRRAGASWREAEAEGAFYGPKIDLQVVDPAGREDTLSTIQLDLVLPERFDLGYDAGEAGRLRPVIVHRSVLGSLERMTAHLLEVHDGALPPWLSPVQVRVLPASADACGYAAAVGEELIARGLRADCDARDATLGARVRTARERRIPYLAIVGARERDARTVSVRLRDGSQPGVVTVAALAERVRAAVGAHSAQP